MSLTHFLLSRRLQPGDNTPSSTFLSYSNALRGKFLIKNEDKSSFYSLYNRAINNNEKLSLLETQNQNNNYLPLIVDIDLKQEFQVGHDDIKAKLYTKEHVFNIVQSLIEVLDKSIVENTTELTFFCCIMEREPYVIEKNQKKYKKSGLHLHFPYLILNKVDIMNQLLPAVKHTLLEKNLSIPECTTVDKLIDDCIYNKKGKSWFLYGSSKPECPDSPYLCTTSYLLEDGVIKEHKDWETQLLPYQLIHTKVEPGTLKNNFVEIFSIQIDSEDLEKKEEYCYSLDVDEQYLPATSSVSINTSRNENQNENENENYNNDVDITFYRELLDLLPLDYSEERDKWIYVCWITFNVFNGSHEGFILFDEFSQKCPSKYNYESTRLIWNKAEKKNLTLGSLRYLVQQFSPIEYKELCKQFCDAYIEDLSDTTSHYDIAKLLHLENQDIFKCTSFKDNTWYSYKDHIWREDPHGVELRSKISTVLVEKYKKSMEKLIHEETMKFQKEIQDKEKLLKHYYGRLNTEQDFYDTICPMKDKKAKEREIKNITSSIESLEKEIQELKTQIDSFQNGDSEKNLKSSKHNSTKALISKLIYNLKSSPFKKNIMVECKELFHDHTFASKLDVSSPYLICFRNGVFDLESRTFRPGTPDDLISRKLNINYREDLTMSHPSVQNIIQFFETLFPDKEIFNYFISVQRTIFVGKVDKLLHVWTGSGDNGKSLCAELFEKMLGDLAKKLPTSILTGKRTQSSGATPELAQCGNGVRMVQLQECDKDETLSVGQMKEFTGGDSFYARKLHSNAEVIRPCFKTFLCCNDPPKISSSGAQDEAVWRRLRLTPFESYFPRDINEVPQTAEERLKKKIFPRDNDLHEKLDSMTEPLAFYLINCYYNKIYDNLPVPNKVTFATNKYRQSNDVLHNFLNEMVDFDASGDFISINELYQTCCCWMKTNYSGSRMFNISQFKEYLEKAWGKPSANGKYQDKAFKANN